MRISKYLKNIVLGSMLLIVFLLSGCAQITNLPATESKPDITITDMSGAQVKIPVAIDRIADAWPAHHAILCILGEGDKVVATTATAQRPWMGKINPQLNNAVAVFDTAGTNMEELVKAKPDIIFITANSKNAGTLAKLGIPVVQLHFTDFDSLKECVRITGAILGEQAKNRAEKYIAYLDGKLAGITAITAPIPREQRPKVLHITSLTPLMVDGKDTIVNSWIEVAGGNNVADMDGNGKEVSLEQVSNWNPDIIILGNTAFMKGGNIDGLLKNPAWQHIRAIKDGKVYINPEGVFFWDRYGAEEALQIQWAAKLLHPNKFEHINMVKETIDFFKTFYNYDLSVEEADKILNGKRP